MVGGMRAKLNGVFTGIVEELGEVVDKEDLADAARFVIRGPVVTSDAGHGDSIAVNGVCLTVVEVLPDGAVQRRRHGRDAEPVEPARLEVGSRVNLERAAALNSRLGGHIVQGHVDGTGTVLSRTPSEHWEVVRIALPDRPRPLCGGEGLDHRRRDLADGVRAGCATTSGHWFEVSLIPTTLELTTLGGAAVGTPVNLEVDVIAKYVERLLQAK